MSIKNPFAITTSELIKKTFPENGWVVESLVPTDSITVISGQPSSYKTWIALHISQAVSEENAVFGVFKTNKNRVLMIDEESGERWIQQRLLKLGIKSENIFIKSKEGFRLTDKSVDELLEFTTKENIGLVIFDSFVRVHTARDENDSVQMANVFRLLQRITKNGLSVILTHHHRKQDLSKVSNLSQEMRGSSDILAAIDCHLAINRKGDYLIIKQTKLRQDEEIPAFKVNIISEDNELKLEYGGISENTVSKKDTVKSEIIEILTKEGKLYKKQIFDKLQSSSFDIGYSTFKVSVQEMVKAGELLEEKGEKNITYCFLPEKEQVFQVKSKKEKYQTVKILTTKNEKF